MATATVASMLARSLPSLLPNVMAPAELKLKIKCTKMTGGGVVHRQGWGSGAVHGQGRGSYAVSVGERAANEAACVFCSCALGCVCVWNLVFSWCSAPPSLAASFVAALVLCSCMHAWRVSGVVAGRADATSALDAGLG